MVIHSLLRLLQLVATKDRLARAGEGHGQGK